LVARAVINENQCYSVVTNGEEIKSKIAVDPNFLSNFLFNLAETNSKAIIFIDKLDELESCHVSQLITLIACIDKRSKIVLIAATQFPNLIDPKLLSPGRLDTPIVFGNLDVADRLELLKFHTRNISLADDVNLEDLSRNSDGLVGADFAYLCIKAAMQCEYAEGKLDDQTRTLTKANFLDALTELKPSAVHENDVQVPVSTAFCLNLWG
jgi:transitional endoplasmic reticulum ATPase